MAGAPGSDYVAPMHTPRCRSIIAIGLALAGMAVAGCRNGWGASSPDPIAAQIAQADQSLQGTWVLVQSQPNPPLDPVLASLLAAQYGQMRLTFDHGLLTAQGVGIQFTRRYQVTSVDQSGRIHVVLRDDMGAPMETDGEIHGDTLKFNGRTSPWMGTGVLQRAR